MRVPAVLAILLLLPLVPAGAAQGGDGRATDPPNDVKFEVQGVATSPPPVGPASYVDLIGLEVSEPSDAVIRFRLTNSGGWRSLSSGSSQDGDVDHRIVWNAKGAPGKFVVTVRGAYQASGLVGYHDAALCYTEAPTGVCSYGGWQGLLSAVRSGALEVDVNKRDLTKATRIVLPATRGLLPDGILPGEQLEGIHVLAQGRPPRPFVTGQPLVDVKWTDRMPDGTGTVNFRLTRAMPAIDLTVGHPGARFVVIGGETNEILIPVKNEASRKRIVEFEATARTAAATQWKHDVTPQVLLGAGEATNITLRVSPPSSFDSYAEFGIRANIISEPGSFAEGSINVSVTQPFDAEHRRFFLHRTAYPFQLEWQLYGGLPDNGWLTRRSEEPHARDDGLLAMTSQWSPSDHRLIAQPGADRLPNNALVKAGAPAQVHLEFQTPVAFDAKARVSLMMGEQQLGIQEKDLRLEAGLKAYDFSVPIDPKVRRITPQMGWFQARITFDHSGPDTLPLHLAFVWGDVEYGLKPRASWIELPIEREPLPRVRVDVAKLALVAHGDTETFVNPGRSAVFEVELRNEDRKRIDASILVQNVTAGWIVDVRPVQRVQLEPNRSVLLGVVATAAKELPEGANASFQLVVIDAPSGEPIGSLGFLLTATRGIDIPDQTFSPRPEDADLLTLRGKGSPAPAWPLLAAVGLLVVWLRRRAAS